MWYIWVVVLLSYGLLTWRSLLEASAPIMPCQQESNCFHPAIVTKDELTIQLELFESPGRWIPVETCRIDLVIPASGKLPTLVTREKKDNSTTSASSHLKQKRQQCELTLPAFARHRSKYQLEVKPLKARFLVLYKPNKDDDANESNMRRSRFRPIPVSTVPPFFLTRIKKREPKSMMNLLWNTESTITGNSLQDSVQSKNSTSSVENNRKNNDDGNTTMWIPYLKFGRTPIRIRFVTEDRCYGLLQRADGIRLNAWNVSFYAPMMYVDELSLAQNAQIELAPFEDNKPPIKLQIKFGSISPMVDTLNRQVHSSFEMIESMFPGPELDEIRYFLQDERLYRFALTNIISTLHLWFDFLAFRDEVHFYRGRQSLSGVSSSTVIARMICSLIIILSLIDGGGTSWVVLVSLFSSLAVEIWKVWKILQPRITSKFPFVTFRQTLSKQENQTAEYDRIAYRKLSMLLYPLVFGLSIYALKHYEYKSLYSWFISNLANAVYLFGFICLCPQLYVNYRLKSVAHLPWKVFMYKIFSTFVDDAFAWLIEMPLKHRLMTLRDDFVLLLFLIQVYLYRVDKTRSNEFGYSYEIEKENGDKLKESEINHDNIMGICSSGDKESTAATNEKYEKLKED